MASNKIKREWLKWKKQVKRREAAFKKMGKLQKRVAIAKDVLAQLDAKLIKATKGHYIENELLDHTKRASYSPFEPGFDPKKGGKGVRECLLESGASCTACAVGSIFVAGVLRANKLKVDEWFEGEAYHFAEKFFEHHDLMQMENLFEAGGFYYRDNFVQPPKWPKATQPTKRLRLIMQNIIDNGGKFKPEQFL